MKYWTFQNASRLDVLNGGRAVYPRWDNACYQTVGSSMEAYQYLLEMFNRKNQTNASGLIFGYMQPTEDAVYEAILKAGAPSGSYFSAEKHRLLELNVPNEIAAITVDFYRFSDLLFSCGDESLPLEIAKRDLLKPNGDTWELAVTHIEGLRPEWIAANHVPRNLF